jgi:hypothetical protein
MSGLEQVSQEQLFDIQTTITTAFETNIRYHTIFLSTDLEPDDMMAIKLLSKKLAGCLRIYVVIGEHQVSDIEEKCKLFYILAEKYGFLKNIQKNIDGKTIIYKGHPSSKDDAGMEKKYPQLIFNKYNTRDFTTALEFRDLKTPKIQTELFDLLDSQTIFLLMKPPKELFLPTGFNKDDCRDCLAFMYGSFNKNELNDYMKQQNRTYNKRTTLVTLARMFSNLIYVERKPEMANYFGTGEKDFMDPNPFFGVLPPMKILGDDELSKKSTEAYKSLQDDIIDFCTKNWQTTILETVKKLLKLHLIPLSRDESNEKRQKTEPTIETHIADFKRIFFSDPISAGANFVENANYKGYFDGILDDTKLIGLLETHDFFEQAETEKIGCKTVNKEKAQEISKILSTKAGNKWGMMIGIVVSDGLQTPLADQLLAVLILHPQEFTIKRVQREEQSFYTVLDNPEPPISITEIAQLQTPDLNPYKLALYKKALTKIKESGDTIAGVQRAGYKIRKSKKVNIHKRIKTRRKNRRKKISKSRISRRKKAHAKNKKRHDYTKRR